MREAFNTTCDLYAGPGAPSPGLFIGTFPCRFVREDAILPSNPGVPVIQAYLTLEAYNPRGCFTYPSFGVDADIADRVIVATHPGQEYWVVYSDRINWYSQSPYFRAYLATLPPPSVAQLGGVLLGGSATISMSRVIGVDGGVLLGGSATISMSRVIGVDGGVLLGGSATWSFTPGSTYYVVDTFTDSNGVVITSHTPDVGGPWYALDGTMEIQSDSLQGTVFSSNNTAARIDSGHTDYHISVEFTIPLTGSILVDLPILMFRTVDRNNSWFCYQYNGSFYLECRVAGVTTYQQLAFAGIVAGTTYTMFVYVTPGGNINAVCNGVNLNVSNATWASETHVGLWILSFAGTNDGTNFDNLYVGP